MSAIAFIVSPVSPNVGFISTAVFSAMNHLLECCDCLLPAMNWQQIHGQLVRTSRSARAFRMTDLGIQVLRERHGVVPGRHASLGIERGNNFVLTVWILLSGIH